MCQKQKTSHKYRKTKLTQELRMHRRSSRAPSGLAEISEISYFDELDETVEKGIDDITQMTLLESFFDVTGEISKGEKTTRSSHSFSSRTSEYFSFVEEKSIIDDTPETDELYTTALQDGLELNDDISEASLETTVNDNGETNEFRDEDETLPVNTTDEITQCIILDKNWSSPELSVIVPDGNNSHATPMINKTYTIKVHDETIKTAPFSSTPVDTEPPKPKLSKIPSKFSFIGAARNGEKKVEKPKEVCNLSDCVRIVQPPDLVLPVVKSSLTFNAARSTSQQPKQMANPPSKQSQMGNHIINASHQHHKVQCTRLAQQQKTATTTRTSTITVKKQQQLPRVGSKIPKISPTVLTSNGKCSFKRL